MENERQATAEAAATGNLALRLATNSVVQILGNGLASVISLGTFVAVTRGLGPAAYGDYVASISFLLLIVGVADSGLSSSVLRTISAAPERTVLTMRAALPLRVLVSVLTTGLVIALAFSVPFNERVRLAILIGSVGAFASLLQLSLLPVLQAQLRMHWAVAANVAGRIVTLGLTLGAIERGFGFVGVIWAHVAGLGMTFLVVLLVVARTLPLRPTIDVRYWWQLVRGSLALGLAIGLGIAYLRVDTVLLAVLLPASEVGLYGAAYKFLELTELITVAVGLSIFPVLARLVETSDLGVRAFAQRAFDILLALAAPVALLMVLFAEPLLTLAAGEAFADAAPALRLLGPYVILSFTNALLWRMLIAARRDRTLVLLGASILTLKVGLDVALVPVLGFVAAAGVAVAAESVSVLLAAIVLRREFGFLPRLNYAPVVAGGAATMAALGVWTPGPWPLAAALGCAAYAVVVARAPGTVRDSLAQVGRSLGTRTLRT